MGGTFVDVVLAEPDGRMTVRKTPTNYTDPSEGLIKGLGMVLDAREFTATDLAMVLHGTTLATNAVIEQKHDASLGLIVSRGFRDVLEIARQTVPGGFGSILNWNKPDRIVPLELIYQVTERVGADGGVSKDLDEDEVRSVAHSFRAQGIKHVGVSLLHSYANSAHEERIEQIFAEEYPECKLARSSAVYPEFREYERTVLTLINAFLLGPMSRYLENTEGKLKAAGVEAPFLVMQSNGGVASAEQVDERPVYAVLSGPAGGVTASAHIANLTGSKNLITVDIGGTSTDIGLVVDGKVKMTTTAKVGDYPIALPMVDVNAIGSGGGSLAWLAPGNSLKVGPKSAGSEPGPACYGRGGTGATTTDANLLMGRVGTTLANGEVILDKQLAEEALARVGKPLGLTALEAASGIIEIASENMCHGVREVTVRRGQDPRDFKIMAYGGAGPLFAGQIAKLLGVKETIIPPIPGAHSAMGLLFSSLRQDRVITCRQIQGNLDLEELNHALKKLVSRVHASFEPQGAKPEEIELTASVDIRYLGQGNELSIEMQGDVFTPEVAGNLFSKFHDEHNQLFRFKYDDQPVEIVSLRMTGLRRISASELQGPTTGTADSSHAKIGDREVYFDARFVETPIYDREKLLANNEISGPAIVNQLDTTIVIHPGQLARTDEFGNLIIFTDSVEGER